VLPLVVGYEKPRTPRAAALGVPAVVLRLSQCDTAGAQDLTRLSGDSAAAGKVAGVVVGCR
jgi:hypothetical protein